MVLRNESTWYNPNNSFGEIINKFQDSNIYIKKKNLKNIRTL